MSYLQSFRGIALLVCLPDTCKCYIIVYLFPLDLFLPPAWYQRKLPFAALSSYSISCNQGHDISLKHHSIDSSFCFVLKM